MSNTTCCRANWIEFEQAFIPRHDKCRHQKRTIMVKHPSTEISWTTQSPLFSSVSSFFRSIFTFLNRYRACYLSLFSLILSHLPSFFCRYFCRESVGHFHYLALELCQGSFRDFVENPEFDKHGLKPLKLLHETSLGVSHLHSLKIIHR